MKPFKVSQELKNSFILIGVGLIISIFFPSDIFYIIRTFIEYIVLSSIKLWYLLLLYTLIIIYSKWKKYRKQLTLKHFTFKYITINLLIILLINFSINLYSDLFSIIPSQTIKILYAGCYTQNNSGYLIKDNESIKIDKQFEYELSEAAKLHHTFNTNICGYQKIEFPKFLIAFSKIDRIKDLAYRKLDLNKIYCSIYFIKSQSDSKLDIRIKMNDIIFMNLESYDRFSYLLTSISKDENINSEILIRSIARIYVATAGQSVLETFLRQNQSKLSSRVVIDSENLFVSATNFLSQYGNESTKMKINDFRNYWLADLERYKGLMYSNLDQPISAINHYFNALIYDIYYPHETYHEMKYRIITDYDASLDTTDYKKPLFTIPPTIEIIKDLIISKDNQLLVDVTLQRFEQLETIKHNEPYFWYCYGELLKYCRIDGKKYNKIYEKRFDSSITAFEKALSLDPTFSVVYSKISALKYISSQLTTDSLKSKQLKEDAKLYMDKDLFLYDLHLER